MHPLSMAVVSGFLALGTSVGSAMAADMLVTVGGAPDNVTRGQTYSYNVVVTNRSNYTVNDIEVSHDINGRHNGLANVSYQGSTKYFCKAYGDAALCDRFGLGGNKYDSFNVTVRVADNAPCGAAINFQVALNAGYRNSEVPVQFSNVQTSYVDCGNGGGGGGATDGDLRIDVYGAPETLTRGQNYSYDVIVTNYSDYTVNDLEVAFDINGRHNALAGTTLKGSSKYNCRDFGGNVGACDLFGLGGDKYDTFRINFRVNDNAACGSAINFQTALNDTRFSNVWTSYVQC